MKNGRNSVASLFLASVTDGSLGTASLFTQIPSLAEGKPVELFLNKEGIETEIFWIGNKPIKPVP